MAVRILVGLACLGALAAAGSAQAGRDPVARAACGVERWPEKTLQDKRATRVRYTPKRTTVDRLRRLKVRRDPEGYRQGPIETTNYRVRARLIEAKTEDDGDIHLVIASLANRKRTMIVEFPSSECISRAPKRAQRLMRAAHRAFDRRCGSSSDGFRSLHGTATIDGVGFFDFIHGQTGVAPNGIELHPVLRFRAASC